MPKKTTIDDLARMVNSGFTRVESGQKKLESRMTTLEQGQEDIKLRLDNVGHKFEIKALEKRVKKLEEKIL